MAKILISYFWLEENKNSIFFESFINSLAEQGNDILYLNTTGFLEKAWNGSNKLKENIQVDELLYDIMKFSPELCITFNNSIPSAIVNMLDIPIVIWHADTFMYFNDKDRLKLNPERYFYICPFERDIKTLKKELSVSSDRILNILPATSVKSELLDQDSNISFIGSLFQYHGFEEKLRDVKKRGEIIKACNIAKSDPLADIEKIGQQLSSQDALESFSHDDLMTFSSIQDRNMTLASLYDLGMKLYGKSPYFDWLSIGQFLPNLGLCVSDKDVYTLKHNQDIYNRSRVSVSISHSQAAEGFPWRVFDIMASNSCLLSDKRQGIADFTKGYVDIPMFSDPFEARKLAKALLGSENLRNQIIQGSNACIEDKGRWHHRFRDIGEAVGVSLINGDRIGSSKQIFSTDFIPINKASERITELQRKYHNKIIIRKTLSLYKKIRGL